MSAQWAFDQMFPVLQSFPYNVRGRFRQAARRAQARSHFVRTQNLQGDMCGWKLFCMLTQVRFVHVRRVEHIMAGSNSPTLQAHRQTRRAAAACRKVQMCDVTRNCQCLTGRCSGSRKRRRSPGSAIEASSAGSQGHSREVLECHPRRSRSIGPAMSAPGGSFAVG